MFKSLSLILLFFLAPIIVFIAIYFGMNTLSTNQDVLAPILTPPAQTEETTEENPSSCGNGICEQKERASSSCPADCQ